MGKYDAIVIGSGFGGAVTACRLAEAGYTVLILERGRRWGKGECSTPFPRDVNDPWVWDHTHPEMHNGWADFRVFPNMTVVQGAGVGGGSLIYANICTEAPPHVFENGWPREITYAELKPHYDEVGRMLRVRKLPMSQWNSRTKLMQDAAKAIGKADRFKMLDLAVSFDEQLVLDPQNPPSEESARKFMNEHGIEQGYCVHVGKCDIGCPVFAKNTLDITYIARAEKNAAEVRPLCLVTGIQPIDGGYRVYFDELKGRRRVGKDETARLVILSAGSLGSTELLLRCRDVLGMLSKISPALGQKWSSNGDFLTPAYHPQRRVSPTIGPTISSAIDFLDGSETCQTFWVQDGGFPHLLGNFLGDKIKRPFKAFRAKAVVASVQAALLHGDPFEHVMPWFAQGVDASDGALRLKRPWWFFGDRRLHLDWHVKRSMPVFKAIEEMHNRLAKATGGVPMKMPGWFWSDDLVTPHPLGGCSMGDDSLRGVVDHMGEVFGYRNLFVLDGAIFPRAIGVNPSRTIAALAERAAQNIIKNKR
jgi:cholesterol oxidase